MCPTSLTEACLPAPASQGGGRALDWKSEAWVLVWHPFPAHKVVGVWTRASLRSFHLQRWFQGTLAYCCLLLGLWGTSSGGGLYLETFEGHRAYCGDLDPGRALLGAAWEAQALVPGQWAPPAARPWVASQFPSLGLVSHV